jgi:lipopolysaccharide transport system permease protein
MTNGTTGTAAEPEISVPRTTAPALALPPRPAPPTLVIEPVKKWPGVNWAELWAYRELAYFMVWKELKVRYHQTILGIGWAVLQPLLSTVIFTVIFGRLAKVPSNGVPYPVFALSAMVPWIFFSTSYTNASATLIGHATMLSRVYFPRLIFPLTPVVVGLVDFGVSALLLALAMLVYGIVPSLSTLFLVPLAILMLIASAAGLGSFLAAASLEYRDVKHTLPFLSQIWMYASPIVYPLSLVPEQWQLLYALNPMVGVITAFRAGLFGLAVPWGVIGVSFLSSLALMALGIAYFRRNEPRFADVA